MKYKIKNKKMKLSTEVLLAIIPPILILVLWEVLGKKGVINASILPYPSKIYRAFILQTSSGKLQANFFASIGRIVKGFIIGSFLGMLLGLIMGLVPIFDKILSVLFAILRPMPIIALIPFFILWLGIGEESKVAIIILCSFWPVLLNTTLGIKSVDVKLLEVAQIQQKGYIDTVFKIIIPSALPVMINGIRLAAGGSLMGVVTAEMIAASRGLGYMIMFARELSQADVMLVGVITIGLLGLILDKVFVTIVNRLMN